MDTAEFSARQRLALPPEILERFLFALAHGNRSKLFLIAFSESPSDSTWLENAQALQGTTTRRGFTAGWIRIGRDPAASPSA
jgi:hypothetical protein